MSDASDDAVADRDADSRPADAAESDDEDIEALRKEVEEKYDFFQYSIYAA